MTESQKAIFITTALIATDAIQQTRDDLIAQRKFTLANELRHTLDDIRTLWRELAPDTDEPEPDAEI